MVETHHWMAESRMNAEQDQCLFGVRNESGGDDPTHSNTSEMPRCASLPPADHQPLSSRISPEALPF